jgi:diaminopimelate decarboxylase
VGAIIESVLSIEMSPPFGRGASAKQYFGRYHRQEIGARSFPFHYVMGMATTRTARWFWAREGCAIVDGRLSVAGHDAEQLAREHGTPLYAYDLGRVADNADRLRTALERAGVPHRVRFALKANREPEVLAVLRGRGVGIDASSPGEVELALRSGWTADEISYTGTNVSERDLDVILGRGVHMNVDLLSQLRRYGRRAPGTAVGLRINPRAGGAYAGGAETLYSGAGPTKFGIYEEDLDQALAIAAEHRLAIDTVHIHIGDGFLDDGLAGFETGVAKAAAVARRLREAGCPIREVNTGGGLGNPQAPGERPLDLDAYAAVLARQLGELGVTVSCEPGDFLVKDSAVLLCEVITVEDRLGTTFVGLDAGWNVMPDMFVYGVKADIVLCRAVDATPTRPVTVTGHINEGNDVFAEGHEMPDVAEGDIVALMDVGGYHQAMTSPHCLRPPARVLHLRDRLAG